MSAKRHPIVSQPALIVLASVAMMVAVLPTATAAAPPAMPINIAPASRVEQIDSPDNGLPDQEIQHVAFDSPLKASLITVWNRGGDGHRSFALLFHLQSGGTFAFSAKEGSDDRTLALTQPIPVTAVSIRCDSFSAAVCRYTVSLAGD